MALERADSSARVLGARALAARDGAGPAAAFSALAAAGPDGLVPPVGTGGAVAARHLEYATRIALADRSLPDDVIEALSHAATAARAQAGGANALDPRGVAIAVRREVAAVRGLVADGLPRHEDWHEMRLGTFLPRAGWMSALLLSCAQVAGREPGTGPAVWHAAALVAGVDAGGRAAATTARTLLGDRDVPVSVAYAMDQVAGALLALSRRGVADGGPLALARATSARLATACAPNAPSDVEVGAIADVLEAIGAIAGATYAHGGTHRAVNPEPAAAPEAVAA